MNANISNEGFKLIFRIIYKGVHFPSPEKNLS